MTINKNTDKKLVREVRDQIRKNNHSCPYFLEEKGIKGVHCFCQDILDAPEGTYCHTQLYYKEIENVEGDKN